MRFLRGAKLQKNSYVNKKILNSQFSILNYYLSLQSIWSHCFHRNPLRTSVKRESGENPGQSRCCEFEHKTAALQKTSLHGVIAVWEGEGERRTSQKTCQIGYGSECFRGKVVRRQWEYSFPIYACPFFLCQHHRYRYW